MSLRTLRDNIFKKRESKSLFWNSFFLVKDFFWRRNRPIKNCVMEKNLSTPLRKILWAMRGGVDTSSYFGVWTMQSPLDFWIYQEIIFEVKPDVIIEIGNFHGGSTLALAHLLDSMGKGKVIGVDIDHDAVPNVVKAHPRITLITGDACRSFSKVKELVDKDACVLIIEDSSHIYKNTLNVLRTYNSLVTKGSYFIVEDGILNHGVGSREAKGPYEAVETFVKENSNFNIDRSREKFVITWNPKGYLKKIS